MTTDKLAASEKAIAYFVRNTGLELFSLKSIILDLAAMAASNHEKHPYLNWDKDERLLLFLSHYVEN